ncbi:MAG: hypothetical protein PHV36_10130 [Elusimicrobiales bacterium]|nr:hypothetical protein [Elusimicrobiales bacterium]
MNLREKIILPLAGFTGLPGTPGPAADRSARFAELYRHAFRNSPVYREKYSAAGLSPDSVKELPDSIKLPFLEKEELSLPGIKAGNKATVVSLASGSTSGPGVNTRMDGSYLLKRYRMLLEILYSTGWRLGDAAFAFHPEEYGAAALFSKALKEGALGKIVFNFFQESVLYRLFHNRKNFLYSSAAFGNFSAERYFSELRAFAPRLVISRPDILCALMRQAAMKGLEFPEVESVLCVGNILSSSGKAALEDKFKTKVYNLYASTELGYVGLSCPSSGVWVHVDEDNYLAELDGTEVIVTDFSNYHTPVIRYRTGDAGELVRGRCGCGREGLRLKIKGRKKDFFENSGGERFYACDADEFLASEKELYALQIAGKTGALGLTVRPGGIAAGALNEIKNRFCGRFKISQDEVSISCEAPLSGTPSGKFPFFAMEHKA